MQGFYLFPAIFLAPIIPQMGFYGLKYKAFSIIQQTLNSELRFSYKNEVKEADIGAFARLGLTKYPSIHEVVQLFTLIYNAGHFYQTFVSSRALVLAALEDGELRTILRESSTDPRFSVILDRMIENRDYQHIHLLNSLLVLENCNQNLTSVAISKEIIYAYLDDEKSPKAQYIFELIRIIRNVAYISFDLQIAQSAIRIDLNNDDAVIELLRERIIEYNNHESSHNLITSIQKMLDDTVYNEKRNALILYDVTRYIIRKLFSVPSWADRSYYRDLFLYKDSMLNKKIRQRANFYSDEILKLTFTAEECRYANDLIYVLDHTRFIHVGFYNRPNNNRTVVVAIGNKCPDPISAAFSVLRKVISTLRSVNGIQKNDTRFLLAAKFFLYFLFDRKHVKLKATVSQECTFCCRGHKDRLVTLQDWIKKSNATMDTIHEGEVMLSCFKNDKKNDTVLALPCSIQVMDKAAPAKAIAELDGIAIYPNRERNQVLIIEGKNRSRHPQKGASELKKKLLKLNIITDTIVPMNFDATAVISIGRSGVRH